MSGANVHVAGLMGGDMGGQKESQGKFRKHHQEVGDALNNIAEGIDKDEPRPGYTFKRFPMMIYHSDQREQVVDDEVELKQYLAAGFRKEPYPKPKVYVSSPELEKQALLDNNRNLQGQITTRDDLIARMAARLDALEAKDRAVPGVDVDAQGGMAAVQQQAADDDAGNAGKTKTKAK